MTEHPRVIEGMKQVYTAWIDQLDIAVYRSRSALPADPAAPKPTLALGETTQDGRTGLVATAPGTSYAQATFALRVQGQKNWTILGIDDAAPYRVFTKLPPARNSNSASSSRTDRTA